MINYEKTQIAYDFVKHYNKIDTFIFTTKIINKYNQYKKNNSFLNMMILQFEMEDYFYSIEKDITSNEIEKYAFLNNFDELLVYIEKSSNYFNDFRFSLTEQK